jgi:hypothetical protein
MRGEKVDLKHDGNQAVFKAREAPAPQCKRAQPTHIGAWRIVGCIPVVWSHLLLTYHFLLIIIE